MTNVLKPLVEDLSDIQKVKREEWNTLSSKQIANRLDIDYHDEIEENILVRSLKTAFQKNDIWQVLPAIIFQVLENTKAIKTYEEDIKETNKSLKHYENN